MKLEITQRKDRDGVDCVAPFIDDWNVWDIPKKQWSQAVEQAINTLTNWDIGPQILRIAALRMCALLTGNDTKRRPKMF